MKTTLRISLAVWALSASIATAASPKPNILHIHADDHRPDGLRALGNEQLQTPHLDTLVKHGFVFTHCYTQGSMVGAVCLPSRTMLLTGRSLFHIPKPREGNPEVTLPRVIRSAGYETFHMGKGGNEYTTGLNAFDTNLLDDKGVQSAGRGRDRSQVPHASAQCGLQRGDSGDYPAGCEASRAHGATAGGRVEP